MAKLLHGHSWDVPRGTSRGQRGIICERKSAEVQDYATKKPQESSIKKRESLEGGKGNHNRARQGLGSTAGKCFGAELPSHTPTEPEAAQKLIPAMSLFRHWSTRCWQYWISAFRSCSSV